jgi:hypothetical protein
MYYIIFILGALKKQLSFSLLDSGELSAKKENQTSKVFQSLEYRLLVRNCLDVITQDQQQQTSLPSSRPVSALKEK